MRYAIDVAPLGDLADPVAIVRLAKAAEAAGWDGLSTWDSLGVSMGTVAADPFVTLAAVAASTERLRLILSVAVLPRRRPQLLVQSTGTLDRISGGRLVLGIGAGADPGDFEAFGEGAPLSERVALMDAALPVVDRWLRGEAARLDQPGAAEVAVGPRPLQVPRPPVWFGGMRPGALRRAARWDGWIALATSDDGSEMVLSPDALGEMIGRVNAERAGLGRSDEPFDVALFARSDLGGANVAGAYAAAGATWWLESLSPMRGSPDELLAVVEAGPPRLPASAAK
ncbi:MAG TPA: LLM class flavin-dependent oxidoreductase [Candidatus Sulfomarinibacteraceae bacterium]|nr:LLM class flavin-dependent oxidoreductase [Candidatus Sulfomarinibacteraceae bacterium]